MPAAIIQQYADYTKSGLGFVTLSDEHGFPTGSFAGLWYLTKDSSGTHYANGASVDGPFYDESGNGNHASIVSSSTPEKQTWGLDVTDADGLVLDTGINFPASGTAIVGIQSTVSSAVAHHQFWLRPNLFLPATKSGDYGSWEAPSPSMTTTANATADGKVYENSHGILDTDEAQLGETRLSIPKWRVQADGFGVLCFRWNNVTGRIELFSLNGGFVTYQNAGLIGYFSAFTAFTTCMGIIPFSTIRPCTGRLFACALATSALDNVVAFQAMNAVARMKYFTGGTLLMQGYNPPTI